MNLSELQLNQLVDSVFAWLETKESNHPIVLGALKLFQSTADANIQTLYNWLVQQKVINN